VIIANKTISRRAALRGFGAVVALPLLEAMAPTASAMDVAQKVRRFQVIYMPNGMIMDSFRPATGPELQLSPILQSLAPFRDKVTVISGLSHPQAEALGDPGGDHGRACGTYLTGVHVKGSASGGIIKAGPSVDQIIARQFGEHTPLPSLELGLEEPSLAGSCDQGFSCAFTNTMSWADDHTPLPIAYNPRLVFERLFGDGDSLDPKARAERLARQSSILDYVMASSARLSGKLGVTDRQRFSQYLDSVRDFERRLQRSERAGGNNSVLPAMMRPAGIPDDFVEHAQLMIDLQILAYQTDVTRVGTFMIGREVSSRSYPELGFADAHHPLSHHGRDPEKMAKLTRINTLHMEQTAYFLKRLSETRDGEKSLLDSTVVMSGSSLADSNNHEHVNLPLLVATGLTRGNRHLTAEKGTPMTNLMLSLMEMIDVRQEQFGDSSGRFGAIIA
jgi:hypothetical protein